MEAIHVSTSDKATNDESDIGGLQVGDRRSREEYIFHSWYSLFTHCFY